MRFATSLTLFFLLIGLVFAYPPTPNDGYNTLKVNSNNYFETTSNNSSVTYENASASWGLNESTGNYVYDSSGNNNTGTISGATWTSGYLGSALEFDGVDDYVEVINDPTLDLQENFTIESWIWLDNNTTNPIRSGGTMYAGWVILDGEGDGWDGFMFGIEAAIPVGASNSSWSRLTMLSEQGSGGHTNNCAGHQVGSTGTVVGLNNVSKGEWNHVAVVYNSTIQGQENLEFYINGVLDIAYQCDFTFTPNLEKRSIGSEDGGQSHLYSSTDMGFFDGKIDELAVWQRTLAPEEVSSIAEDESNSSDPTQGQENESEQASNSTENTTDENSQNNQTSGNNTSPVTPEYTNGTGSVGETNNSETNHSSDELSPDLGILDDEFIPGLKNIYGISGILFLLLLIVMLLPFNEKEEESNEKDLTDLPESKELADLPESKELPKIE